MNGRKAYGDDLYKALKEAQHILLVDMYAKELQDDPIPEASTLKDFELQSNQTFTYIICDTESFQNVLELYEEVQKTDLIEFLRKKEEFIDKEIMTIASLVPQKKKNQKKIKPLPESSDNLNFEDSFNEEIIEPEKEKTVENNTPKAEVPKVKPNRRGPSKNATSQKKLK